MANRLPERAKATCEGLGFVVVGAEPDNLRGVMSVDPARLDQLVEPYVGAVNGPRWTPTFVADEGKTVLVISVEPPQRGDQIFTLRKEFDRYRRGPFPSEGKGARRRTLRTSTLFNTDSPLPRARPELRWKFVPSVTYHFRGSQTSTTASRENPP